MTETEKTIESATEGSTTQDLVQALNELKANSVSKEEYNKIREDNRVLLNNIVNGVQQPATADVSKPSVAELRDKLNHSKNDLEYTETFLQLRDQAIEDTGRDPTANYSVDNIDYELEQAQTVADTLKECIALAEGSPEVFKAQLMSRLDDTPTLPKKRR